MNNQFFNHYFKNNIINYLLLVLYNKKSDLFYKSQV